MSYNISILFDEMSVQMGVFACCKIIITLRAEPLLTSLRLRIVQFSLLAKKKELCSQGESLSFRSIKYIGVLAKLQRVYTDRRSLPFIIIIIVNLWNQ